MILDNKEITDWLDEICKKEPFKSTTDISLVIRADDVLTIVPFAEPEKYKDKEIHFFVSSWVKESTAYAAKSVTKEVVENAKK